MLVDSSIASCAALRGRRALGVMVMTQAESNPEQGNVWGDLAKLAAERGAPAESNRLWLHIPSRSAAHRTDDR